MCKRFDNLWSKATIFLDYYAASKLNIGQASTVIKGIAEACIDSGCSLLGGETAEMPGHYVDNNFDLAGFAVGCVEKDKIISSEKVSAGNILIGIESSGPHSNGFSLIRKVLTNYAGPTNIKKENDKRGSCANNSLSKTYFKYSREVSS